MLCMWRPSACQRRLMPACRLFLSTNKALHAARPEAAAMSSMRSLSKSLSEQQVTQLEQYLDYMLEVNQVMNLTAVRDRSEAWDRHICDSLVLLPVIDYHWSHTCKPAPPTSSSTSMQQPAASSSSSSSSSGGGTTSRKWRARGTTGKPFATTDTSEWQRVMSLQPSPPSASATEAQDDASPSSSSSGGSSTDSSIGSHALRVIDVGTGAGLPGMVLAVARPHWKQGQLLFLDDISMLRCFQVTLLDSLRKRCDFLKTAAAKIGLNNVDVVWCRAEEGGRRAELRQAYDMAVARAVAETPVLAELCLPFVRVGGLWVAAKGPNPQEEVATASGALKQLGGRLVQVELVQSFSAEGQRTAVIVEKTHPTPAKFPRSPGTPNKSPLK